MSRLPRHTQQIEKREVVDISAVMCLVSCPVAIWIVYMIVR